MSVLKRYDVKAAREGAAVRLRLNPTPQENYSMTEDHPMSASHEQGALGPESKTAGQIACAGFHDAGWVWDTLTKPMRDLWERAAEAVLTASAPASGAERMTPGKAFSARSLAGMLRSRIERAAEHKSETVSLGQFFADQIHRYLTEAGYGPEHDARAGDVPADDGDPDRDRGRNWGLRARQVHLEGLSRRAAGGKWFASTNGADGLARIDNGTDAMFPVRCEWHEAEFIEALVNAYHRGDLTIPTHPAGQSAGSGAETDALVDRFSAALKVKLRAAEAKYGWKNGWLKSDWQVECQNGLLRHVGKGDPLDVAAYAAFCWHHGWPSASRRSTDLVTGAVIPTAGAIAAYETRYPDGSLSETSDNTIEAWNRVAAAVCLAEKPAPDSTRTGDEGTDWVLVPAKPTEEMIAAGWIDKEDVDPDDIYRAMIAARPAAPEAQGAWVSVPEEATEEMWQAAREADAHPGDSYSAVWRAMVAAAPPSSGQGGR